MLKLSFLIIFSILSFTFATYGQECGGGTHTISFVQKHPIKYELFSITPTYQSYFSKETINFIQKIFGQDILKNREKGLINIKKNLAEDFLKDYKAENFNHSIDSPNLRIGESPDGQLKFHTGETNDELYLLKIVSKKYGKSYYLDDFLGGCRRFTQIDLKTKVAEKSWR